MLDLVRERETTVGEPNDSLRDAAVHSALSLWIDHTTATESSSTESSATDLVGSRYGGIVDPAATVVNGDRCVVHGRLPRRRVRLRRAGAALRPADGGDPLRGVASRAIERVARARGPSRASPDFARRILVAFTRRSRGRVIVVGGSRRRCPKKSNHHPS
ncbi:MAG: hypothetical protein IPM29_07170 [Planctomycetes bacterium]|nr:hypothetical protein [Planctomycetota bacterium]